MATVVDRMLDCLGLFCPMPVLKVRDAIRGLTVGQTVQMLSDDPASEADIKSWTARTGHELMESERDGAVFRFVIRKAH